MIQSPVPEIAFAQWLEYVACLAEARRLVPARQWLELTFEDLLGEPMVTMKRAYERLGITPESVLDAKLAELVSNPINAMSPPGHEKWRRQNAGEVAELLPRVAGPAAVLGYRVDPQTGSVG